MIYLDNFWNIKIKPYESRINKIHLCSVLILEKILERVTEPFWITNKFALSFLNDLKFYLTDQLILVNKFIIWKVDSFHYSFRSTKNLPGLCVYGRYSINSFRESNNCFIDEATSFMSLRNIFLLVISSGIRDNIFRSAMALSV